MPNTRRARVAFGLVLASGLAATSAACDSPPQHGDGSPRQVTVVGSGHVQGVPDTLTADVGIDLPPAMSPRRWTRPTSASRRSSMP